MSTSSSASPDTPPMAYQVPVPVPLPTYNWAASDQMWEFSPIQVPAWDLDLNLQDQGWGKTWLSALHPGQRGLCHHGLMGTSRWSTQEQPCEVLRLHREHARQWDLPTSHVYELEDITKRSDESINELVDQICQLAHRAQIADGSDAAIDLKSNAGWFGWSQMPILSCTNNFWRSAVTRGYHTC